jgi:hypothetical protein
LQKQEEKSEETMNLNGVIGKETKASVHQRSTKQRKLSTVRQKNCCKDRKEREKEAMNLNDAA